MGTLRWLQAGATVAVAAASTGMVLLGAGVARAAEPVQLKSRVGGWCLDGRNGHNGAATIQPCDGSRPQQWVFNPVGQIQNVFYAADCLSVRDPADGAPVLMQLCREVPQDHQRWSSQPDGQVSNAAGFCLNVSADAAKPGAPVTAYRCAPDVAAQQWDPIS